MPNDYASWDQMPETHDYTDPGGNLFDERNAWMWLMSQHYEDQARDRAAERGNQLNFSGGGPSGAAGGGGAGAADAGVYGSATHPATLNGVTQSGTAFGASSAMPAATGASMSWYNSPWLWNAIGVGAGIYDAKQQRDAMEGQGTSVSAPWGPSEDYRTWGMGQAKDLYQGMGAPPQYQSPGIAGQASRGLLDRAQGGHPLYDQANYTASQLMGGENEYRGLAGQMFAGMGQYGENPYLDAAGARAADYSNPALQRFMDQVFSGGSPSSGGPGGGGGGGSAYYGGGGGGGGDAPVGTAAYIKAMLDAEYGENPAIQGVIDSASRRIREQYEESIVPGITSEWQGSGRYGGGLYSRMQADAAGEFADSLGDTVSGIQYQDYQDYMQRYMDALGLGAQMDESAANRAASSAAARASSAAARASAEMQNKLARDQMLLSAIDLFGADQRYGIEGLMGAAGMLQNAQQFGAGGLLDAGGQLDQTRLGMMGMIPNLTGMDIRDLQAAFGAGQGMEDNAFRDWQVGMDLYNLPMNNLGRYGDLINAFSGAYGTNIGPDPRGPSNLQGAIGGLYTGMGMYNMFGRPQGQQQTPWSSGGPQQGG